MTKARITVLIANPKTLPDDYEAHQQAKQLGWYASYTDKVLEVPGFRPVDEFNEDGSLKRHGPWVVSKECANYLPEIRNGGYYESIQTCIVDYSPLPEAENPWVEITQQKQQVTFDDSFGGDTDKFLAFLEGDVSGYELRGRIPEELRSAVEESGIVVGVES